ncbi:unnamed protein product [Pleuronectes platessa]|uniref:Uncharacterized protein n=1 Tax=Pleuronectes platessa TaxID=8262 RepID=A0A9N7Z615_PLEPL|nr:unnamed protein product [Pleuronectes platessa]
MVPSLWDADLDPMTHGPVAASGGSSSTPPGRCSAQPDQEVEQGGSTDDNQSPWWAKLSRGLERLYSCSVLFSRRYWVALVLMGGWKKEKGVPEIRVPSEACRLSSFQASCGSTGGGALPSWECPGKPTQQGDLEATNHLNWLI